MMPDTWNEKMSPDHGMQIAYQERNLLALRFADGWYFDRENNWDGWKRVLSLDDGKMTFHIPDHFEVGNLPEIESNWDGHTTREKWQRVLDFRGIK